MSKAIRKFEPNSAERMNLELAAAMLTDMSPNRYRYYVGETYFDFGQNWMWTTVLCNNGGAFGSYQALSPAEQERIIFGDVDDIHEAVKAVLADKYCPDRIKAE